MEKHLFSVPINGGAPKQLTQSPGTYGASISDNGKWLVLDKSGPDVPEQYLYSLASNTMTLAATLEDNGEVKEKLKKFSLPKKVGLLLSAPTARHSPFLCRNFLPSP
jgi:dipeptidyl aminopeptidase/acylaminoacyl peptidase